MSCNRTLIHHLVPLDFLVSLLMNSFETCFAQNKCPFTAALYLHILADASDLLVNRKSKVIGGDFDYKQLMKKTGDVGKDFFQFLRNRLSTKEANLCNIKAKLMRGSSLTIQPENLDRFLALVEEAEPSSHTAQKKSMDSPKLSQSRVFSEFAYSQMSCPPQSPASVNPEEVDEELRSCGSVVASSYDPENEAWRDQTVLSNWICRVSLAIDENSVSFLKFRYINTPNIN